MERRFLPEVFQKHYNGNSDQQEDNKTLVIKIFWITLQNAYYTEKQATF